MRTLAYNIILLTILTIGSVELRAAKRTEVEKRKSIEKTYQVTKNHLLDITNKFGRVHINTWDKSQIDVNIEMIARGRNDARAEDLLNKIEIRISDSGSLLKFETDLKGSFNNKKSETFEINYTVNMPKVNPLNLKNSFGSAYLGDLEGRLDLNISYGDVTAEKLTGDSKIKISFGEGELDMVKEGDVTIKYSDVDIEEIGDIDLEQGYSDVTVEKAGDIEVTCKYGQLEIEELTGASGYIGFSDFEIGDLHKSLDLETAYSGGFKVDKVKKGFERIVLQGKFGAFRLGLEEGLNGTFDADLKFADLNHSDADIELTYKIKGDTKSTYKGKIGNGTGGNISVTSSYGDVKFFRR